MLIIPQDSSPFGCMVGIDPSTSKVGVSFLTVNLETWAIVETHAWTIFADRLINKDSWEANLHGLRLVRINAIRDLLLDNFRYHRPFLIASESPFINPKFPQAGIALTEAMSAIREAVMAYNPWLPLEIVPPSNVKNAVGAPGNCDKNEMHRRISAMAPALRFSARTPFERMDEHSIDATAVVYSKYVTLAGESCQPITSPSSVS